MAETIIKPIEEAKRGFYHTSPVVQEPPSSKPLPKLWKTGFSAVQSSLSGSEPETSGIDMLNEMYTSPAEEERLRKASVHRQRIMAVGDALRHLGNIYNTTRYAPSQKLSSATDVERSRYLQDKSERDKSNARFMSYQQAKARQDYLRDQLEAEKQYRDESVRLRGLDAESRKTRLELDERKQEWKEYIDDRLASLKEQAEQNRKDRDDKKITIAEYEAKTDRIEAETSRLRAMKSGAGYTTTTTSVDPLTGKEVTKTTTKTPGGGSSPSVGWDDEGPSVGW